MKNRSAPCTRVFFFFNDTATTEIYTLSLHDALPISSVPDLTWPDPAKPEETSLLCLKCHADSNVPASVSFSTRSDRKSTRLNSSHLVISYAVFCLKKKHRQQTI